MSRHSSEPNQADSSEPNQADLDDEPIDVASVDRILAAVGHHPPDLELTAEQSNPSVRPGCCAAFGLDTADDERIAMIVEVDEPGGTTSSQPRIQEVIADVRREIAEVHHIRLSLVMAVPSGSLPRTTSGKLQRFLCRHAVMSGTLDVLGQWSADDADATLERAS